jgi:hypothetical protein
LSHGRIADTSGAFFARPDLARAGPPRQRTDAVDLTLSKNQTRNLCED